MTQSGWIALLLGLAVIAVLIRTMRLLRRDKTAKQESAVDAADVEQTASKTESPLSEVETACLQALHEVVGREFNIEARVKLTDVIDQSLIGRIDASTSPGINFVLFRRQSGQPTCAIQLRNPADPHQDRQKELLLKSGIRVFEFRRKTSYSIIKIRDALQPLLKKAAPTPDEMVSTISMQAFRQCKKCQSRMEVKRATAGTHTGTLFWVCSRYPECRSVELYVES